MHTPNAGQNMLFQHTFCIVTQPSISKSMFLPLNMCFGGEYIVDIVGLRQQS